MSTIAFFDVDYTLVKGYSGFFTTLLLIQKGILKKRRLPFALFYQLASPFYKGNLYKMYQIAINDMAGSSLKEILAIGRECFVRWIRPRIYTEGIETIRRHRERGEKIFLMTSGPYMTIQSLADFLGVDGRYAAGPVVDRQGILTPVMRRPVCYREGKVEAAEQILKEEGGSWKNCSYYADDVDDLFLLERVGHPRVVNPGRKLLRMAQSRGWPVLRFRETVGDAARLTGKTSRDSASVGDLES